MTIFQKQFFKEIALVTGGLWSTCNWGRRKKKAQLEEELEGL